MITFADIKTALVTVLKQNFEIPVKSQDVTKGFDRPSLTIILEETKVEQTDVADELSATVKIYYFPDLKNNNKSLDLIDMQYLLPKAISNKLAVKDRHLNILEPDSDIVDGIFIYEFQLNFYNEIYEETAPQMTELKFEHLKVRF